MQLGSQPKPSVGVVYDSAMGASIDDALALALLFGLQGKGESRVISVSTTNPNLKSAEYCDVLVRFYTGAPGPFGVAMPIGMATSGKGPGETPIISAVLAKPAYERNIQKLNDTADPAAAIRNSLSAQFDQNAIMVLAGPPTNLAAVLSLPGCKDLIAHKTRYLCISAAQPPAPPDVPAWKKLFAEWPTPIVVAPKQVGDAVRFPAASLATDFSWSPNHPIVDAYHAARPDATDAPSWAMTAALYAVRPQENYFKLSDPGTFTVGDGGFVLTPSAGGKHRSLVYDPAQQDRIVKAYTELASTKPVPRFNRFRPAQKKQ